MRGLFEVGRRNKLQIAHMRKMNPALERPDHIRQIIVQVRSIGTGAEGHAVSGVSGPRQPHVLPVYHRPDHRGRHSGHAGAAGHADPPPALRPGHRRAGRRHRPDPHSRLVDRRHRGRAANPAGVLHEGHLVRGVPHRPAADRGQPDLPPCGGKIRGPAGYLGVLRRHRGQRTGRRRRYAAGRPRLRRDL